MGNQLGNTVVTPYFALLHVPKTGGSFLKKALREVLPRDWFVPTPARSHLKWHELPPEAADLPVLVYVRNPWDWYVSRYHYRRQTKQDRRSEFTLNATFEEMVHEACTGRYAEGGRDFYTLRFDRAVGEGPESGRLTVGRYERLIEDLMTFFREHDVPVGDDVERRLRAAPRVRASEHDHYRTYYTPELRDLVAERCQLVERFGYEF